MLSKKQGFDKKSLLLGIKKSLLLGIKKSLVLGIKEIAKI